MRSEQHVEAELRSKLDNMLLLTPLTGAEAYEYI